VRRPGHGLVRTASQPTHSTLWVPLLLFLFGPTLDGPEGLLGQARASPTQGELGRTHVLPPVEHLLIRLADHGDVAGGGVVRCLHEPAVIGEADLFSPCNLQNMPYKLSFKLTVPFYLTVVCHH
jgi:hypothetical protein